MTEWFTIGKDDDGQTWWLNGDEGTNLRVDEITSTNEFGWVNGCRVGGRHFARDEHDPLGQLREVE